MTWKYNAVLNTGLTVLLNVAAGVIVGGFRLLPASAYRIINAAVFKVFLPALICRGIGLKTDLYDSDIWRFIGAFLLLRVIALAIALGSNTLHPRQRRDFSRLPGRVVVDWLALSWISTVILGVPVLQSAMGDTYAKFGVLAGISSFVFQLPVMLVLLEVHRWLNLGLPVTQQDADRASAKVAANGSAPKVGQKVASVTEDSTLTTGTCARPLPPLPEAPGVRPPSSSAASTVSSATSYASATPFTPGNVNGDTSAVAKANMESAPLESDAPAADCGSARAEASRVRTSAVRLLRCLATNHVLWGITLGFVLSLSEIGTKWLDPGKGAVVVGGKALYMPNDDFVEELGFIDQTLDWLGSCTTPAALFAMGLWIPSQWATFWGGGAGGAAHGADSADPARPAGPPAMLRNSLLHWLKVLWMLAFKLIVCPLLMVGLAKALDLDDATARAAVLVATIPISLASFTLAETFNVGEALLTKLVILGTVLMLPAAVLWLEALDNTDTFLLPPPQLPPGALPAMPQPGA